MARTSKKDDLAVLRYRPHPANAYENDRTRKNPNTPGPVRLGIPWGRVYEARHESKIRRGSSRTCLQEGQLLRLTGDICISYSFRRYAPSSWLQPPWRVPGSCSSARKRSDTSETIKKTAHVGLPRYKPHSVSHQ